jgi:hypothetical protein
MKVIFTLLTAATLLCGCAGGVYYGSIEVGSGSAPDGGAFSPPGQINQGNNW